MAPLHHHLQSREQFLRVHDHLLLAAGGRRNRPGASGIHPRLAQSMKSGVFASSRVGQRARILAERREASQREAPMQRILSELWAAR